MEPAVPAILTQDPVIEILFVTAAGHSFYDFPDHRYIIRMHKTHEIIPCFHFALFTRLSDKTIITFVHIHLFRATVCYLIDPYSCRNEIHQLTLHYIFFIFLCLIRDIKNI